MLWILLMFAGMGLFMSGIVFGGFIDLWYCRTKYDRDDSYKVIEDRENTARKLNREKQKLEKEVHSLYRQIEHITKEWGFEKAKLEDLVVKYKSSSASWYDEWKKNDGQIWKVLDILAPNYKKLSEAELFNDAKPIDPEPIKEEWFDLSKKKPNEGQKIYLKNKQTGLQDLGEFVDRSALGVAFIKRNGQNHTSSLIEADWEWRPL